MSTAIVDKGGEHNVILPSPPSSKIRLPQYRKPADQKDPLGNSNYPSILRGERLDGRRVTIDFRPSQLTDQHLRTMKDVRQIFNDMQSYRNQLYHTHGLIHIHESSIRSKECSCPDPPSTDICEEISQFENELCRKQCVEYVYKIECLPNKKTIFI